MRDSGEDTLFGEETFAKKEATRVTQRVSQKEWSSYDNFMQLVVMSDAWYGCSCMEAMSLDHITGTFPTISSCSRCLLRGAFQDFDTYGWYVADHLGVAW